MKVLCWAKRQLTPDWRLIHRRWSTWLYTAAFAVATLPIPPESLLWLWNIMPREVRAMMPEHVRTAIAAALWLAGFAAMYVKQRRLQARRSGAAHD